MTELGCHACGEASKPCCADGMSKSPCPKGYACNSQMICAMASNGNYKDACGPGFECNTKGFPDLACHKESNTCLCGSDAKGKACTADSVCYQQPAPADSIAFL